MSKDDIDFNNEIINFLRENPKQIFKMKDLALEMKKRFPKQASDKEKRTVHKNGTTDFVSQFTSELCANRRHIILKREPNIRCLEKPLRLGYFDNEAELESTNSDAEENFLEKDLYPIIINKLYLRSDQIFSMRIDEKKSKNSKGFKGNKWLHPDIVGAQDLSSAWMPLVKSAANDVVPLRLWSFEVKKSILMSNVRESFFQAVSNSSWANFGYLVAREIDEPALDELRILCPAHGIGLMLLSNHDSDSNDLNMANLEIVISAVENKSVDWNIVNRIASENDDFADYVGLIDEFNKLKKLKASSWKINIGTEQND